MPTDLKAGESQFKKKNHRKIHLAFLFASPLVMETSDGSVYDAITPISFREEFDEIISTVGSQNIKFKYRYQVANEISVKEALNDNPLGLHFSGHGFQNKKSLFRNDAKSLARARGKGDILLFEKDTGASEFFFEENLKQALEVTDCKRLDFVVVASCHSENAGRVFLNAGVKHVICISKSKTMTDVIS
jgi:hypothetical protein